MTEPLKLATGLTDREVAAGLRDRMDLALKAVLSLMNEAQDHGLQIQFALGRDAFGRNCATHIAIVKPL